MSKDHKKTSDKPEKPNAAEEAPSLGRNKAWGKGAKVLLVVGGAVLLICAALLLVVTKTTEDDAVFTIEDTHYSAEDVDKLIAYPVSTGTAKEDAAKQAYEYLKKQAAAKQANFEPTSQEISSAKDEIYASSDSKEKDSKWAELVAYDSALEKKLPKTAPLEDVKGYVFVFYFGNLVERGEDWQPDGFGNKDKITADKKYAKEQADAYRKDLRDKKATADELLARLNADTKLNYQYKPDNNLSIKLDSEKGKNAALPGDVQSFITKDAPIGTSDVKIGKTYAVNDYKNPTEMKGQETYYYFTDIQDKGTAAKGAAFNSIYSGLQANYKGYEK